MPEISGQSAEAMLTATVLVMLADGVDSEAEHGYLLAAWERATGEPLDGGLLDDAIRACRADPESMWELLATQAKDLAMDQRLAVFKGAILCLLADAEMDVGEMMALRRMAHTLGIEGYKRIMNEVWKDARG